MYAFNITGDLAGLKARHDLVVEAGGTCVMLNIPVMGLPALAWLRSFSEVPIHGHRGGLAASMRSTGPGHGLPGPGSSWPASPAPTTCTSADSAASSTRPTKRSRRTSAASAEPLGQTIARLPALSSGQNVTTPGPTFEAVGSTDLMMLAGGGVAAHPDGPGAGVRSLRQAWEAAVDGVPPPRRRRKPGGRRGRCTPARRSNLQGKVPEMPAFGFVADDLTGAADVLGPVPPLRLEAAWSSATALLPPRADVVGIAGPARSLSGQPSTTWYEGTWPASPL